MRALLINPSYRTSYGRAKIAIVNPIFPTLGIAMLAAAGRERGHDVHILDLSWKAYDPSEVRHAVESLEPDVVGISATTPLMNQLRDMSVLVKELRPETMVLGGGAHASALPEHSIRESALDAVVVGEGDESFAEILDGRELPEVTGLYLRDGDAVRSTGERTAIDDLDALPLPAWDLFDLEDYGRRTTRLYARYVPFVMAEFSRGCIYRCDFCASKTTMALGYRKKSPSRCAAEVRRMAELGVREFHLADDIFTTDAAWAGEVADAIRAEQSGVHWTCTNGIRVESASADLFRRMRLAGCYRVSFGLESGDDRVLTAFGKGGRATLEAGREAVRLAREAGLETTGFFLLGLSSDDEASMRRTVEYARALPLDSLKFAVAVPFPGAPMFDAYQEQGLISALDWDEYHVYTSDPPFAHPVLDVHTVQAHIRSGYRRAILLNPAFAFRRFLFGLRTGRLFREIGFFFKFLLMPSLNESTGTTYGARNRWPEVARGRSSERARRGIRVGRGASTRSQTARVLEVGH